MEKAERERVAVEQEEKRKRLFKQELAWMRAGVQARGTKQQARIDRFQDLKENLHQVQTNGTLEADFATQRLGKKVLEIKEGNYAIDHKQLLKDFNLLIQANDRIGITGKNGAGKSTLLNILAGRIPLESGLYSIGETVRIGYYTQQNEEMDPNQRMIAYLQEAAEEVKRSDGSSVGVAEMLERFLFPRFMHGTLIGKLSGGEKRRLYLLKLLISQPNVLLLDEPTNDLDIDTLTILEDYIQTFKGAVIAGSHDRYFLDKTMDKLLVFQGNGQILSFYGTMSEYLANQKEQEKVKEKPLNKPVKEASTEKKEKTKLTYMEQKEWATIEEDITQLETKLETLTEEMNHQGDDFVRLQELQEANALQQQQLSELDKKANSLKEDMDQLNNLENELKQLSGIELPEGNNGDSVNPEQNGQGGPYPQTPTIENVRLTLDTVENTMNGKLNNMEELKKRLQTAIMMKRQQVAIANQTISITPSIWPAKGVVSSPYGLRWGGSDFHPGIDIANDMGTPIRATADGVVSIAGWNSGGYGNMVDIDHGNGVMTRYGHASYVVVSAGQQVKRGQIIAYMGSTGFSTGPHVHYEVRINGQAVDPSGYLFN